MTEAKVSWSIQVAQIAKADAWQPRALEDEGHLPDPPPSPILGSHPLLQWLPFIIHFHPGRTDIDFPTPKFSLFLPSP